MLGKVSEGEEWQRLHHDQPRWMFRSSGKVFIGSVTSRYGSPLRDYDVEYASGYTNLDVITFSWDVEVNAGGPFDTFHFWLEAEGYAEYITLIYPTWETLGVLSEIFHITAESIVIEDDGSVNIRKTLLNNGVKQ